MMPSRDVTTELELPAHHITHHLPLCPDTSRWPRIPYLGTLGAFTLQNTGEMGYDSHPS